MENSAYDYAVVSKCLFSLHMFSCLQYVCSFKPQNQNRKQLTWSTDATKHSHKFVC